MKSESGFSLAMANQPFKSKPRPGRRNQKSLKICFRRRNLNFLKMNLMNSLRFSSISCVSSSPFPVYYVGFPMDMDKVWVLIKYTLQGLETWQSHNISYFRIKCSFGQQTQKKSTDAQSRAKKVHRRCQIAPTKAILKGNHYFILMSFPTSVTHRISLNFFHRSLKKKRGESNTTTVPIKMFLLRDPLEVWRHKFAC